jgi:hypothetical protein
MNIPFRVTALIFTILISMTADSADAQPRGLGINKTPTTESQRVALVIGNSNYANAPLKNPVNDARDVAQALRELGFEVVYRENVNQNDMKRAIRMFGERTRSGGTRFFYYAGHGVQMNGENYLIPVGADFANEQEIEYESVNLGLVLAQMEEVRNSINIVVLDACRNNPFPKSSRSVSRGLASVNAPTGTLIAYATAPGSVASDGTANNGIYTQELLRYMRMAGVSVEEIFKRVRVSVREKTQGKQTPWESSSLTGDFYFMRGKDVASPVMPETTKPSVDSGAMELSFWDSIKNSEETEDFKAYLQQYPHGTFAVLARRRIQSLQRKAIANNAADNPESSTEQVFETRFIVFKLQGCKRSGAMIVCSFTFTNKGRDNRLGFLSAALYDNRGNAYEADERAITVGNSRNAREGVLLPTGATANGQVPFEGINPNSTQISLMQLKFRVPSGDFSYDVFDVTFRNVSI